MASGFSRTEAETTAAPQQLLNTDVHRLLLEKRRKLKAELLRIGRDFASSESSRRSVSQMDLKVAGSDAESGAAPMQCEIAWQYFALGFTHIIPNGTDHVLFVVGIFLLTPGGGRSSCK